MSNIEIGTSNYELLNNDMRNRLLILTTHGTNKILHLGIYNLESQKDYSIEWFLDYRRQINQGKIIKTKTWGLEELTKLELENYSIKDIGEMFKNYAKGKCIEYKRDIVYVAEFQPHRINRLSEFLDDEEYERLKR